MSVSPECLHQASLCYEYYMKGDDIRNCRTLGSWLRRNLEEHVVSDRILAENTGHSFRDSFALLLPYVSGKARKPVDRSTVDDLTADRRRAFLNHVETGRGGSVETRPLRGLIQSQLISRRAAVCSPPALCRTRPRQTAVHHRKSAVAKLRHQVMADVDSIPPRPGRTTRARGHAARIQRCRVDLCRTACALADGRGGGIETVRTGGFGVGG